ncbi:hypothetical protein VNO80_13089 [Phaseolus coccineus]|uniref:Uncharacterized protein n=1 Tax=Phaseolus coccineus TaxID=3886 RepID=A0AAN9N6Z2_PHACN
MRRFDMGRRWSADLNLEVSCFVARRKATKELDERQRPTRRRNKDIQSHLRVFSVRYLRVIRKHVSSKIRCGVVNVYAACNLSEKVILWEALSNVISAYHGMVLQW